MRTFPSSSQGGTGHVAERRAKSTGRGRSARGCNGPSDNGLWWRLTRSAQGDDCRQRVSGNGSLRIDASRFPGLRAWKIQKLQRLKMTALLLNSRNGVVAEFGVLLAHLPEVFVLRGV